MQAGKKLEGSRGSQMISSSEVDVILEYSYLMDQVMTQDQWMCLRACVNAARCRIKLERLLRQLRSTVRVCDGHACSHKSKLVQGRSDSNRTNP